MLLLKILYDTAQSYDFKGISDLEGLTSKEILAPDTGAANGFWAWVMFILVLVIWCWSLFVLVCYWRFLPTWVKIVSIIFIIFGFGIIPLILIYASTTSEQRSQSCVDTNTPEYTKMMPINHNQLDENVHQDSTVKRTTVKSPIKTGSMSYSSRSKSKKD